MQPIWTAQVLYEALSETEWVKADHVALELIQGSDPSLHATMHDHGDLPLYLAVMGEQIVVEALLWPVCDVKEPSAFNEEVLRSRKLFPLSSIGLEKMPNGQDGYIMFGALSSSANLSDVVFEVELLAGNVIKATQAYEDFLKPKHQQES
ncbi:YjfI family protein [Pseudomonas sp. DG56-2]|uniref:YjfI family protein n=1 Tax=Pseudomonas sp. DG56-2 TaxID=2320270 RepID=UPI002115CD7B|nr:YjfI family protein [Pseudomonas sp. DG56-2]